MPTKPRRRSLRLAAKAKADARASTTEKEARKTSAKATGRPPRPSAKSLPGDKQGGEKTRTAEGATEVKNGKPSRKRESRSRARGRCSLQSLGQTPRRSSRVKAQEADKASCNGPKTTRSESTSFDIQTPKSETMMTDRRLTPSPATKPNPAPVAAAAHPKGVKFDLRRNSFAEYDEKNPPSAVELLTPKGVKFDLGRNSFAEYEKENPPSVVHFLNKGVNIATSPASDDPETKKNGEILAEWDRIFDDCPDRNVEERAEDCCEDYYMNVTYRKRTRRSAMLPRRISMTCVSP